MDIYICVAGLHGGAANAVFCSRDRKDRINRRISKDSVNGGLANSLYFDARKTACKHEDIDYLPE